MKNNYLLFALIAFCSLAAGAQSGRFHVNGGIMASQIDGDQLGGYKKPGYNFGAGFLFEKSTSFELDWSIRMNQKGVRETSDVGTTINVALTYLESDLSFNHVFNERFYLGGGLGIGYLMFNRNTLGIGNDQFRKIDLFPQVMIGVKATEKLSFQIRNSVSIITSRQNLVRWRNRSILLEVRYLLKN